MHPSIPGYRLLQEIHRSGRSRVYRGVREADQAAVVLKTPALDFPGPDDLGRLRREHQLLGGLDVPGVVKVLDLVPWGHSLALVLEDVPATPVAGQLETGRPMELAAFFPLAMACGRALGALHPHAIHKDLNPRNILWEPRAETFRLIDFGSASGVAERDADASAARRLVASLAFMAPEQTGRLNREVDGRTDFYSLGVTFYLLLTGQLPFQAGDPVEWIHCHLSQTPAPPEQIAPAVPPMLGAVVLKLLAKNPEDRYQSAAGLLRDLGECERRFAATGAIAPFELGLGDVPAQFQLPARLYGREAEISALIAAFQDAAAGHTTLVTVAGPSGIGKSALVAEAFGAIEGADGRVTEGKFDQFHRHVPYAAVTQALNGLARQIMAEPEASLAGWKARLLEALGPNGRIAVDLVPALAAVIGLPAPVAALNPTEEQNRFLSTIQSLIRVFARPEHPLVLFLDDLQWSDPSSLLLMRSLLASCEGQALLLIGAYRDDEVGEGHPLALALADLERSHRVHRLQLAPLPEATLNAIVADALQTCPEETGPLSRILHHKTAGNPFFVRTLLGTLHQDGLVAFDHAQGHWGWDLEGVQRSQVSDDIVHFMLSRIQRLAPETQALVRQAACMGNAFARSLLAALVDRPADEVDAALAPAVAAGLLVPVELREDTLYQFAHDRVRQAAYALNEGDERQWTHLRFGRLLERTVPADERASRSPEIAQQLNAGRSLLETEAERLALVALNLEAARKSKASAAYRAAFDFTSVAIELLPAGRWEAHYPLAFEAHQLHASCAYLSGDLAAADACYEELLARSRTLLERAEVRAMRAAQYTFGNRLALSVEEGIRALELLGIRLTPRPSLATVARELATSKWLLGRRSAAELEHAPLVEDRAVRLSMKVLEGFLVPAYLMGNETLFAATVLKHVNLSLRHGNCLESVSAFAGYAVLLAGLGDFEGAHAFGRLALRLTEKFGVIDSKCRTLTLYTLFGHSWSEPWGTFEGWFKEAVETGLQTGDFLMMAFSCGYVHLWDPRIDLATAVEEGRKYIALCRQTPEKNALEAAMIAQQFRLCLRGETLGPLSLSDAGFDEAACLARMRAANYVSGEAIYHLYKLQAACFAEAWEEAWALLLQTDRTIKALAGSPYVVEYCVYGFLAAARIASDTGPDARKAFARARRFSRQMQRWARHNGENFGHHALLMQAELARLAGRHVAAARLYDRAVTAARESGFVRFEAQANEVAARHFRSRGLDRIARTYLRDAREGYLRWGATAKVKMLDAAWPELTARPVMPAEKRDADLAHQGFNLGLVPQLVESGALDLATIWKATQAISGEATLERLLAKLMAIVKEHAGAQRAVLVLRDDEETSAFYRVQAESHVSGPTRVLQAEPLEHHPALPVSVIRYVLRSQTSVLLNHPARQGAHTRDPYFQAKRPQSVLALPIVNQGHLLGALYLENSLLSEAFTPEQLSILRILAGQAAVSIRNVRGAERAAYLEAERAVKDTYARELEARVQERTAELQQAYQRLTELDRLKTNFLSVVSHELRTPLTTIQGYVEFLEDGTSGSLSEEQAEYVEQIQQGACQLRRLVDDLLDFARVEAGTLKLVRKPTEVPSTIARALESLVPTLQRHGLQIETEFPAEPVWLEVDAGRLSQVVLNLVGNAVKFTPRGGTIRVSLRQDGAEYRIAVQDSGIGIDPEHLPRLFQRFYQVDSSSTRERGGVGLGLSIAQSLIEAHGGRIGVESTPGAGSTFWFTLPAAPADQAASASGAAAGGV